MKKYFSKIHYFILATILFNAFMMPLTPAQAAVGGDDIGDDIKKNLVPIERVYDPEGVPDEESFTKTIYRLVQIALGFLGVIFIVLMLYAGFNWMTAAGMEDKIDKAKKTIVAAVVGLLIILSSYAIAYLVFETLFDATGAR